MAATLDRRKRYLAWRARLTVDPAIMGGAPVFPETRLTVHHVGGLLLRPGADQARAELEEDYPYLSADDFLFAPFFVRMHPAPRT